MQDHEARASDLNRKLTFSFFLLFSWSKLLKHNKQGPKFAVQQLPWYQGLNYSNIAIFWRLFGFDFNFFQYPSVKFSGMLKTGIAWQEETFKIEKSRGCQGSFFVFSIFVFFWLSENLVLQIFLKNWKQGKLIRNNFSAKFHRRKFEKSDKDFSIFSPQKQLSH